MIAEAGGRNQPPSGNGSGWSAEELQRFQECRHQGDLFNETPRRLLDATPWIVHLIDRCQDPAYMTVIDSASSTGSSLRCRRATARGGKKNRRRRSRATFEIPFAANRVPMIFVGNQGGHATTPHRSPS
jgi:hypothetical protein